MSYRRPFGLLSISCALASCAATLPVGTADGRAGSRHSGETPTLAEVESGGDRTHVVQAGETLWRIAQNHDTSVDALMELNGISDPTTLSVGLELKLPGAAPAPSEALARARALARGGAVTREPANPGSAPVKTPPAESSTETSPSKPAPDSAPAQQKAVAKAPAAPKKAKKRVSVARYPLRWPVRGKILRRFGRRGKKHHDGIDIGAGSGAPVAAAASGKVVFAAEHGGYGKLVLLRHASGLITVYAHQSELLVKKGQSVRGGDVIARVGASGNATSPHLHFEVRKGVETQNPLQFLPP